MVRSESVMKSLGAKKKKILKYTLVIAIIFTVSGFGVSYFAKVELEDLLYLASKEEAIEFAELAARYEQGLWGSPNRTAADEIAGNLVISSAGLYFKDVNYSDNSRAAWQPSRHISLLLQMVRYYGKEEIGSNETVRALVLRTLDYWLNKDIKAPNWWYNEIGIPKSLADIGIMLKPFLSTDETCKINRVLERGALVPYNDVKSWTGANLMDGVDITIKYAFFAGKPYLLKKAVAYAEKEIFISGGETEGIKPDYSFYQHGAQQAIASYGLVFTVNLAELAHLLNGTSFQLSETKLGILVDYILHGQRYALRGNQSNYLTNGRSYSRRGGSNANSIRSVIGLLLALQETPKKEKLQEFYNSFNDLSYSLNHVKYFPYSHTLFDISPDYYIAVKGAYQGFINSELVNYENLLARNLGYGGVTVYQYTGHEYDEISAVWDFAMLPGTTAFYETDEKLASYTGNSGSYKYRSTTTHSGGAGDSLAGGVYVDIENEEGLYSRQAYICYKGLMIGLGNSITCSNSGNTRQIFTTINQVYADNASFQGSPIEGTRSINDNSAVFNGAFAYYNLGGGDLTATVESVTGNLNRNNLAASGSYTADVFKLYYAQGTTPVNQSFAYAVLANPHDTAPAGSDGLPIARITNTPEIQSVEFADGMAVVIFHQAGSFTTISGKGVSADSDCVKIVR